MRRFSLFAVLGVVCSFLVIPVTSAAAAASGISQVHYTGVQHQVTPTVSSRGGVAALPVVAPAASTATGVKTIPYRSPAGPSPAAPAPRHAARVKGDKVTGPGGSPAVSSAAVPSISASSTTPVLKGFNGLDNQDSSRLIGGAVTPPDQGLCVGTDTTRPGSPQVVWEAVNEVARETTTSGSVLQTVSLFTLFQDPYAGGDPRCFYDPATKTFFFTEIGYTGGVTTLVDLTVVNSNGAAHYAIPTSEGGTCFGDQPKTGFSNKALVFSTDQYCTTTAVYGGALLVAVTKAKLVAEGPVKDVVFPPLSGILGLDPAINTGTTAEYLVNSVPFIGTTVNLTPDTLGYWSLTTTFTGTSILTGTTISSEYYTYPVLARSSGNGATHIYNHRYVITSEKSLNPDDNRTSGPVYVTPTPSGGLDLWTAVSTALETDTTFTLIDGAAWFEVSTRTKSVVNQGYVGAVGDNMLYPAVLAPRTGPVPMVFTLTSPTLNPSVAYTTLGSTTVRIVAPGASAHKSFADAYPFKRPRWGDYSFVAPNPTGSGIWMATEYIPPTPDQNPYDNWGTYVFEVAN